MVYGIVNIAKISIHLDIISNYLDKNNFLTVQIAVFEERIMNFSEGIAETHASGNGKAPTQTKKGAEAPLKFN